MRATASSPALSASEDQLARLWEGQRFPPEALVTRQGETLQVVYRGQRGRGPGPDFRDAIIATSDGQLLQGDVELHVRAGDYRAHGHHLNPAYDGLALHVVFWDDAGEDTLLASGRRVPVVALAPWVARRAAELRGWLASPPLWREPCQTALGRLGRDGVAATLDRLGDRRFARKAATYREALKGAEGEEVLYGALCAAMGYGGDRAAFGALAGAAPWRWLREALASARPEERAEAAEALLLGAAGFLPNLEGSPYAEALTRRWRRAEGVVALPASAFGGAPGAVRPANHPQRRIAGLARLLARYALGGLAAGLEEAVRAAARGQADLLAALRVGAEGFWATHLELSGRPWRGAGALIGAARAGEMAVNGVLPFFSAQGQLRGDDWLEGASLALYRRLPRPAAYGVVHFLEANLGDRSLVGSARHQQALLYLAQEYCRRGGCGRCPLS